MERMTFAFSSQGIAREGPSRWTRQDRRMRMREVGPISVCPQLNQDDLSLSPRGPFVLAHGGSTFGRRRNDGVRSLVRRLFRKIDLHGDYLVAVLCRCCATSRGIPIPYTSPKS